MGMVKVIANVDEDQKMRLYHVLLDEKTTFSEWLRRQIDAYLEEREPRGKKGAARVREQADRRREKRWATVQPGKGKKPGGRGRR